MTYALDHAAVPRSSRRSSRSRTRAPPGFRAAHGGVRHRRRCVLIALTAVFDNVMIAAGLFTYPEQHLSGLRIGLAPIEDFTYALCAALPRARRLHAAHAAAAGDRATGRRRERAPSASARHPS